MPSISKLLISHEWYNDPAILWEEITDIAGIGIYLSSYTKNIILKTDSLCPSLVLLAPYLRLLVRNAFTDQQMYDTLAATVARAEQGDALLPGPVLSGPVPGRLYRVQVMACADGRVRIILALA